MDSHRLGRGICPDSFFEGAPMHITKGGQKRDVTEVEDCYGTSNAWLGLEYTVQEFVLDWSHHTCAFANNESHKCSSVQSLQYYYS